MRGKAREAVASAGQLQADVSYMNGEKDALAAECKEFTLQGQCLLGLAEKAKNLCAHVSEIEGRKMLPKMRETSRVSVFPKIDADVHLQTQATQ